MISAIVADTIGGAPPEWCRRLTWEGYAEKRYDRVKEALVNLLRPAAYSKNEGDGASGWTIDGQTIIVWEPRDAFGRSTFDWEDVPSTLVNQDASRGGITVLHRNSLERFIDRDLHPPGRLGSVKRLISAPFR